MSIIVHCADLHLNHDTPGQSDPAFAVFQRIIDRCNRIEADLLLIAGDLYDSVFVSEELIHAVQRCLARCVSEVYICGGNHDYCAAFSPLMTAGYSTNVHILPPGPICDLPLPQYGIVLHGCSFDAPHQTHSPLRGFQVKPDGLVHIGLLHADLGFSSDYAPITTDEVANSGLDYLALGHFHTHIEKTIGKTHLCYPGIPQPRRFDENGGVVTFGVYDHALVLFQNDPSLRHSAEWGYCDLSIRHHSSLNADLTGCSSDEQASKRIHELISGLSDPLHTHVLVTLQGETASGYHPNPKELQQLCSRFVYELQLKDHTVVHMDPYDSEQPLSLQGIFLSKLEERMLNAKDDAERAKIMLAKKYGMQAFYGEVTPDADSIG